MQSKKLQSTFSKFFCFDKCDVSTKSFNRIRDWRFFCQQTLTKVAEAIWFSERVIFKIWNRISEAGNADWWPLRRLRQGMIANEGRHLNLTTRIHWNKNNPVLQQCSLVTTGNTVWTQTVRICLYTVVLYASRRLFCVTLAARHRLRE